MRKESKMSITTDLWLGRAEVVSGWGTFPNREIAGGGENELLAFNAQPTGTVISRRWGKGTAQNPKQTKTKPKTNKQTNKQKTTNQPSKQKKKKKKKSKTNSKKKEEKRTHAVNNLHRKCCSHYWKMHLWGKE